MEKLLQNRGRIISLFLVIAVLLAYMPGLAETVYGEDAVGQSVSPATVIELGTDDNSVNDELRDKGLGLYAVYDDAVGSGDTCELMLKNNLNNPNLYFEVNVGATRGFSVEVLGEVTIGGIVMKDNTRCRNAVIKNATTDITQDNAILNASEISLAIAAPSGTELYFSYVDINADNFNLDITKSDKYSVCNTYSTINAKNMTFDCTNAIGFSYDISDLNTPDDSSDEAKIAGIHYNVENFVINAGEVRFIYGDFNIKNLTHNGGATNIHGANVKVTGELVTSMLQLTDGSFEMDVAKSSIGAIDFDVPYNITQLGATAYTDYIAESDKGVYQIAEIKKDGSAKLSKMTSGIVKFGKGYYGLTVGAIDTSIVKQLNVEIIPSGAGAPNVYENREINGMPKNLPQVSSYTPVRFRATFEGEAKKVSKAYVNGVETPVYGGSYTVTKSFAGRPSNCIYEGYVVLGNVTEDQVLTFDFATPGALCEVNYHFQGNLVDTILVEKGQKVDLSNITVGMGMMGLDFDYFTDSALTKQFDPDSPIMENMDIYIVIAGTKVLKGSFNVDPIKACENTNYYALANKHSGEFLRNAERTVMLMPAFMKNSGQGMLFAIPKASLGSINMNDASLMNCMVMCDALPEGASPFTDSSLAYFAMYQVQTEMTTELDDSFKFMCGNQELFTVKQPKGLICFVPIEICDHDFYKLATTGSATEFYKCAHCDTVYKKDGNDYSPVGKTLASVSETYTRFTDEYTVDEDGNYVFTLTEDLAYVEAGNTVVDGDLIIDLNGHNLVFNTNTLGIGATGDVTIKNGSIDMSRIKANNLILDNATCYANLFYKGNGSEPALITNSIVLKNGAVLDTYTKNEFELDDGITIEINDTSKIIFSEDSEAAVIMQLMSKPALRALVNANLIEQIKNYLPRTAKVSTFDDMFNLDASGMDPSELAYMRSEYGDYAFIEVPGGDLIAANWPSSSGHSSKTDNAQAEAKTETKTETTTTENADGSKTTTTTTTNTVSNTDGSKVTNTESTAVTTDENGNTTTVVTNEKTVEAADGSKATVKSDESGNTIEASATISEKALETAKAEAKAENAVAPTVTLQAEVKATKSAETAAKVTIDVPTSVNKENPAKVEIPVENMTVGTVAVIVNEDGTETVLKTGEVTENGLAIEVTGDVTVKIVDNSKTFVDVPKGDWAADPIQFVASRGIFNGIGGDRFAPNDTMSRGMLAQVMQNFAGNDKTGDGKFSDLNGKWYAGAANWAAENGLMNGSGAGFDGDEPINREQLATTYYRLALLQGKVVKAKIDENAAAGFGDAKDVSEFAKEAIDWCISVGLMNGMGGNINPRGMATRAQVSAMTQRYCAL